MKEFKLSTVKTREKIDEFKIGDEEFDLLKPSDSAALLALHQVAGYHPKMSPKQQGRVVASLIDFLGTCLSPADYQRLYQLLVKPEEDQGTLETEEIVELCRWAAEKVTARPTKPSTGSRGGRSTSGRKSPANSSSAAARRQ